MKKNIKSLLDAMKGNQYHYKGKQMLVISWQEYNEFVILNTDEEGIKLRTSEIEYELKSFKPIDADYDAPVVHQTSLAKTNTESLETLPLRPAVPELKSLNSDTITKLQETLMDNIQRVKDDKNYIPQ